MSTWVKNLVNSITNIKKNINLLNKILNFDNNDNINVDNLYDLENNVLSKNNELSSNINELLNLSKNMIKTPITNITRFSNQNLDTLSFNDTLDLIGGCFNNELLVTKYNISIKKDISIINAIKLYDSNNNILFNNKGINLINFNTLSKVGRMDINDNFENNTISESSYKTCVVGDIICDIEVSISKDNEENWKNEIESLYNQDIENSIIPNIKTFPKTHYNNTSINIKDKENSILYTSGILNPYINGGDI